MKNLTLMVFLLGLCFNSFGQKIDTDFGNHGYFTIDEPSFNTGFINKIYLSNPDQIFLTNGESIIKYNSKGEIDSNFGEEGILINPFGLPFTIASGFESSEEGFYFVGCGSDHTSGGNFALAKFDSKGDYIENYSDNGIEMIEGISNDEVIDALKTQDGRLVLGGYGDAQNNFIEKANIAITYDEGKLVNTALQELIPDKFAKSAVLSLIEMGNGNIRAYMAYSEDQEDKIGAFEVTPEQLMNLEEFPTTFSPKTLAPDNEKYDISNSVLVNDNLVVHKLYVNSNFRNLSLAKEALDGTELEQLTLFEDPDILLQDIVRLDESTLIIAGLLPGEENIRDNQLVFAKVDNELNIDRGFGENGKFFTDDDNLFGSCIAVASSIIFKDLFVLEDKVYVNIYIDQIIHLMSFTHQNLPLSLNELNAENIIITPNPTAGLITLPKELINAEKLIVISTDGKVAYEQKLTGTDQLDLSALPIGMYQLRFEQKDKAYASKIVIQH